MTTWVTSDPHFYHSNIIRFCGRPFADVPTMNAGLAANINSVVQPNDRLIILGDFILWHDNPGDLAKARESREAINCKNVELVTGNHDPEIGKVPEFDALFAVRKDYMHLKHNRKLVCLFHYPIETWNKCHHGSICLFGHGHRTRAWNDARKGKSCDVGVDAWGYFPQTLESLIAYCDQREIIPHDHGQGETKQCTECGGMGYTSPQHMCLKCSGSGKG